MHPPVNPAKRRQLVHHVPLVRPEGDAWDRPWSAPRLGANPDPDGVSTKRTQEGVEAQRLRRGAKGPCPLSEQLSRRPATTASVHRFQGDKLSEPRRTPAHPVSTWLTDMHLTCRPGRVGEMDAMTVRLTMEQYANPPSQPSAGRRSRPSSIGNTPRIAAIAIGGPCRYLHLARKPRGLRIPGLNPFGSALTE